MNVLEVQNLCKAYPAFSLGPISFSLEEGKITGFIGRNGAGKSTTLNALFNTVHKDGGDVAFFGLPFAQNEMQIKQRIGFVSSGVNYYSKKKLKVISNVTRSFYPSWDDGAYERYMRMFSLDENKTPDRLSAGMRVKYALVLALSHNADLLILDEPTSGLDPVSRDDLLEVLMQLCDEGKSILFSTHITSDLDKCADNIIYIKNGKLFEQGTLHGIVDAYKVAAFESGAALKGCPVPFNGAKRVKEGYTALVKAADASALHVPVTDATLEDIMVHVEKEAE